MLAQLTGLASTPPHSDQVSSPARPYTPADRECKMIVAAFNAVLGLQVCHEFSALAVDGLDQVTWAQGSQGRFAPSMNLWLEKACSWHNYDMAACTRFPSTSEPGQFGLVASVTGR